MIAIDMVRLSRGIWHGFVATNRWYVYLAVPFGSIHLIWTGPKQITFECRYKEIQYNMELYTAP